MRILIILCGGSGSRLWPLSNENKPKQFLNLIDHNETLLQSTYKRGLLFKPKKVLFITNYKYSALIYEQIQELISQDNNKKGEEIKHIIIEEPIAKNTCPAISAGVVNCDKNDIILTLSADHLWEDNKKFESLINNGLKHIKNSIVLFGINPSYPEIGYGYINYKNNYINKFVEKPNIENAQKYLEDGNYLWNSGNFLFTQLVFIKELITYSPNIYKIIKASLDNATFSKVCGFEIIKLNKIHFNNVQSLSIDYSIMEKSNNIKVVKYDGLWSDIGSYKSLFDIKPDKISGNNIVIDSSNCLIINNNPNQLIACYGLSNLVIINHNNSILIIPKDKSQEVKQIVTMLDKFG
jgi:mannose-1-phosphate guanylyltransferase